MPCPYKWLTGRGEDQGIDEIKITLKGNVMQKLIQGNNQTIFERLCDRGMRSGKGACGIYLL